MKNPILCVVAGNSAGHILPAQVLAQQWLKKNKKGSCIFISTAKQLDQTILADSSLEHIQLKLENISLKKIWKFPYFIGKFLYTCIKSYKLLSDKQIVKVITTGGYIAIPVCLSAKLLGIPIELYELNALPGKTTRFLSSIAQTIYFCFKETKPYFKNKNCIQTAYPLQPALQTKAISQIAARKMLGLNSDFTTLLIIGGSQGSLFINNLVQKWLEKKAIKYKNIQIIHQIGSHDKTDWQALYKKYNLPALVFPYYKQMHELYAATDIIICRSGAGSLFEAVHYNKLCITIPLEGIADNHQVKNALAIAQQYSDIVQILFQHILEKDSTSFTKALDAAIIQIDKFQFKKQNSAILA